MNVFRVDAFARPPGGKYDFYAHLRGPRSANALLAISNFAGRPFPKKWQSIELYFDDPKRPRADFYELGIGIFVCNERGRKLTRSVPESAGEFLPVTIKGEPGRHYIYNVTNLCECMDSQRSIFQYLEPSKSVIPLVAPAFHGSALKNQQIFKIAQNSAREIYCVEHGGKRKNSGLKAMVEEHGLTGLRFDFAWSEKRGPETQHLPPCLPGMGWVTGDGKKFQPQYMLDAEEEVERLLRGI